MRSVAVVLALLPCVAIAADKDEQEMRAILAENFQACNDEDIEALMATCSIDMPDRKGFRKESEILFREKEIHYSLEDFKVTSIDGNIAEAWVVQSTYSDDRSSDTQERKFFRNGTTLLPQEECVEYMVAFKREGGRWKCLATISEPRAYRPAEARR